MKNEFTVNCKSKSHVLKKEEYARWFCLIEAIELVNTKASELNTDLNKDDFWLKPLAFQKYIESRFETMLLDIDREENNVDIIRLTAEKAKNNLIKENEENEDNADSLEEISNMDISNIPHTLESY
jgi:hypothetical protein